MIDLHGIKEQLYFFFVRLSLPSPLLTTYIYSKPRLLLLPTTTHPSSHTSLITSLLLLLPNPPSISTLIYTYIYAWDRRRDHIMGFLKAKGETYKAVDNVDLGPHSNEFYLRANVKGQHPHHPCHRFTSFFFFFSHIHPYSVYSYLYIFLLVSFGDNNTLLFSK